MIAWDPLREAQHHLLYDCNSGPRAPDLLALVTCTLVGKRHGATAHALLHACAYVVRTMCDLYVRMHVCCSEEWERAGYESIVAAWLESAAVVDSVSKSCSKRFWHMHVSTLFPVGRSITRTRVSRVVPPQWFVLCPVPAMRNRHAHVIVTVESPSPSRP
jgi:hypothetical protein